MDICRQDDEELAFLVASSEKLQDRKKDSRVDLSERQVGASQNETVTYIDDSIEFPGVGGVVEDFSMTRDCDSSVPSLEIIVSHEAMVNMEEEEESLYYGDADYEEGEELRGAEEEEEEEEEEVSSRMGPMTFRLLVGILTAQIAPIDFKTCYFEPCFKEQSARACAEVIHSPCMAYIMTLAVRKQYRRMGIAETMLRKLQERAMKLQNCQGLFLHVLNTNDIAVQFYEKHRFFCEDVYRRYYRFHGKCHDALLYTLNLREDRQGGMLVPLKGNYYELWRPGSLLFSMFSSISSLVASSLFKFERLLGMSP